MKCVQGAAALSSLIGVGGMLRNVRKIWNHAGQKRSTRSSLVAKPHHEYRSRAPCAGAGPATGLGDPKDGRLAAGATCGCGGQWADHPPSRCRLSEPRGHGSPGFHRPRAGVLRSLAPARGIERSKRIAGVPARVLCLHRHARTGRAARSLRGCLRARLGSRYGPRPADSDRRRNRRHQPGLLAVRTTGQAARLHHRCADLCRVSGPCGSLPPRGDLQRRYGCRGSGSDRLSRRDPAGAGGRILCSVLLHGSRRTQSGGILVQRRAAADDPRHRGGRGHFDRRGRAVRLYQLFACRRTAATVLRDGSDAYGAPVHRIQDRPARSE